MINQKIKKINLNKYKVSKKLNNHNSIISKIYFSSSRFVFKNIENNLNISKNSLTIGSPIFNNLNIIIRDNPINEDIQKK